jgi:hypothetical protein
MGTPQGDNPTIPVSVNSKLEDLAEKSSQKGTTACYIAANIALRDDLLGFMCTKFDSLQNQISLLKDEVKESRQRELVLQEQIKNLSKTHDSNEQDSTDSNDIYMIGSSILREVQQDDLLNGRVKSISGGHIKDVKENILSLDYKPKVIITQVGGNELEGGTESIDKLVSDYTVTITEAKAKLPDTKIVVAGLPPRHNTIETRTKVKDYNQAMNEWCSANHIDFIDNENLFEFKSGDVDCGSYIMTGATPAVHLTRPATRRMLQNMKTIVPEMVLSDGKHKPSSYANAVKSAPRFAPQNQSKPYRITDHMSRNHEHQMGNRQHRQVTCWFCGVPGHTRDVCRYQQPLKCFSCGQTGHKSKFCTNQGNH